MLKLDNELMYLPTVGPKRAEIFEKDAELKTIADILEYFPYKYVDRSKIMKIADVNGNDEFVQLKGRFLFLDLDTKARRKLLRSIFEDQTGEINVIWFEGIKFIQEKIKLDTEYIIYGKTTDFKGKYSITHPQVYEIAEFQSKIINPIMPEYSTSEKMKRYYLNSTAIAKLIKYIFDKGVDIEEIIPESIKKRMILIDRKDALYKIHFPKNEEDLRQAKYRIKFEELLVNQLSLLKQKVLRTKTVKGYIFDTVGENFHFFYEKKLPFELTNAQKRVIKEIRADMKTGRQANRLLQGDVGSGKTIVALMIMLLAKDNGFQSCLMAPTEVLAQQHFESFVSLTEEMSVSIRLLTGSTSQKQRRIIAEELEMGTLDILIGTHALIEDNVKFHKLGLAIIDEQHKFGVIQRAKLREKSQIAPHIIVMTATPIPRTLSMAMYGDLDISVIDELPANRKPIQTKHIYETQRTKLYDFLKKQIQQGRQVYVVFPLIQESEAFDYKNLEDGYVNLKQFFSEPQYSISMVHGKMSSEEKRIEMEKFVSGKSQIMVATTVIEVGVNVPNATVMVIESAEKFGLSQLHQLRGRVGRGAEQSYCILMTNFKISEDARKRINTMVATNNGFEIAEVDMKLRGPGDILGTQQSGIPVNFKLASLITDGKILSMTREVATNILLEDPFLEKIENQNLAKAIDKEIARSLSSIS